MNCTPARFPWSQRRSACAEVLDTVLQVAVELIREGREGRCVGTIFVVGNADELREHSRPLILDPLHGHDESCKQLSDPGMRETMKELSQLDGAFIISYSGVVVSAACYLDVCTKGVHLTSGLGSRHLAGAAITRATDCVAFVVSASAVVRIYDDGECLAELQP